MISTQERQNRKYSKEVWNESEENEEESRRSKDKIINRQGKDLLAHIEEQGLGIINGNIQGTKKER